MNFGLFRVKHIIFSNTWHLLALLFNLLEESKSLTFRYEALSVFTKNVKSDIVLEIFFRSWNLFFCSHVHRNIISWRLTRRSCRNFVNCWLIKVKIVWSIMITFDTPLIVRLL